jgi:hypothetical protein
MTHICPACRKVCKSSRGLREHITAKHPDGLKPTSHRVSAGEYPPRAWIEPGLKSQPPALDEQIASMTLAFRLYELRQKEAVAEKNVTPHTAYHNCSNVLHALETLRWLRKNEAAIKQIVNGGR